MELTERDLNDIRIFKLRCKSEGLNACQLWARFENTWVWEGIKERQVEILADKTCSQLNKMDV